MCLRFAVARASSVKKVAHYAIARPKMAHGEAGSGGLQEHQVVAVNHFVEILAAEDGLNVDTTVSQDLTDVAVGIVGQAPRNGTPAPIGKTMTISRGCAAEPFL